VCVHESETSTATRTQPPEGSSMGEADGVKRRMFRWPKAARELVREYKERTSRSQEHTETGRRMLVTKLAATSGNPRDACLRFLRELGVNHKRAYREWTKSEQQRLLDLITAMPVEEAAKILRRPAGSVRSMLHRLGIGGKTGREWFTKFFPLSGIAHPPRRNTEMDRPGLAQIALSHHCRNESQRHPCR
jgi:hypothetical protein